jgi:hypothetical protein
MKHFFLTTSAGRLFLLLFALPFGIQFIIMTIGFSFPDILHTIFPITNLVFIFIFIAWLYHIGIALNKKVPEDIRGSTTMFKVGIAISSVYMIVFTILFIFPAAMENAFGYIFPIHLLCMLFMFYALCFLATNYTNALTQKTTEFSDRVGPFMLFWFFPAGIWALQPKIQSLFSKQKTN